MDGELTPSEDAFPREALAIRGMPLHQTFTDGTCLYGAVLSKAENTLVLWRFASFLDTRKIDTVELPGQELSERTVRDMLEEARRDGAWDA